MRQAAALIIRWTDLVARIAADSEIANPGTPRRVHCGLPTKALLLTDFGGGLQHQHLVRGDRETLNLILWSLLRVAALVPLRMTTATVRAATVTIKIFFFMGSPPVLGVNCQYLTCKGRTRQ